MADNSDLMRKSSTAIFFFLGFLLWEGVSAAQAPPQGGEQSQVYLSRDKLRRGLSNTATGWLEIPYKTFTQTLFGDRTPFEDLFIGLTVGTVKAVERTAVGLFETATFPIPGYEPLIEPEYVTFSFEPVGAKKLESEDLRAGLHVRPPTVQKP